MSRSRAEILNKIEEMKTIGGFWPPVLEPLIDEMPDFVEAYIGLTSHPWRSGGLTPKIRHLVALSVYAACTYLHASGIRHHCRGALDAGANKEEILEVLQLTSNLGIHACVLGMPILAEKLAAARGKALTVAPDDARRQQLKAEFIASRGYWNPLWDDLLALDPEYFQAFTAFSSLPWRSDALEPKVKEFVYIATDISATHQFAQGTHIHIENALLKYDATAEEIVEVIQLASAIGVSSFEIALPILAEELQRL